MNFKITEIIICFKYNLIHSFFFVSTFICVFELLSLKFSEFVLLKCYFKMFAFTIYFDYILYNWKLFRRPGVSGISL